MNYTEETVIDAIKLIPHNRKRINVDQRSFLACVLLFKFGLTEAEIAKKTQLKRININYYRRIGLTLKNDAEYKKNNKALIERFPFNWPTEFTKKPVRQHRIALDVDKVLYQKLKWYGKKKGFKDIRTTISTILKQILDYEKLWEE